MIVKMKRNRPLSRLLALENLESRQVLAGNVLASVVGGSLIIEGDAADNGVLLRAAADGGVEVVGTATAGGATTINGSIDPFVATTIKVGTSIDLGAGNDTLAISKDATVDAAVSALVAAAAAGTNVSAAASLQAGSQLNLGKTVSVRLGDGDDVALINVKTQLVLSVDGGVGNDVIGVQGSSVGKLRIAADPLSDVGGNDTVQISGGTSVRTSVSITTGAGDDTVHVGGGSSLGNHLLVLTGAGNDKVNLGAAADSRLNVKGHVTLDTGAGDDVVALTNLANRAHLNVITGAGNDTLGITASSLDKLMASLGDGDDTVNLTASTLKKASFFGGLGDDTFNAGVDSTIRHLVRLEFEHLPIV